MSERLCSFGAGSSPGKRGVPSDELINLYRAWGLGGSGVIVTGNIMIDPEHLEAAGNPVISRHCLFEDDRFLRFARLAKAAQSQGSLILGQVNHPGRQTPAVLQPHPISASDIQLKVGDVYAQPRPATYQDLNAIVEGFAHAAQYLERAGFDGVQLHAAHGYLLAQFLSRTTNHRDDEYGGEMKNRMRLVVRIARAIRARCSARFIVGIKINSVEFQSEGLTTAEARQLCETLEHERFDLVELSGGTYERLGFSRNKSRETTAKREAYFLEFAQLLAPIFRGTRTYLTGGIRSAEGISEALGSFDGVGLARPLCQEPALPLEMMEGRKQSAKTQLVNENDFALASSIAGAQMWQIGRGVSPIDMSIQENVDVFFRKRKSLRAEGYPRL